VDDTPSVLRSFRDRRLVLALSERIRARSRKNIRIMEVCGGHTHAIHRFGLLDLLPPTIRLISGPGCPVCVTPAPYIDAAVSAGIEKGATIVTFGDLLRVPGSEMSLEGARARGANVRIIYSPIDALEIASSSESDVLLLAIGFETTAPAFAVAVAEAARRGLENLYVASALKLMPPAMTTLAAMEDCRIDAFLCPGHVSAVIGSEAYRPLAERFGLACAVSGFEPVDIMESIHDIVLQVEEERPVVYNQYGRVVSPGGNGRALGAIDDVFARAPAAWRGLGEIGGSGLFLKEEYSSFDSSRLIPAPAARRRKDLSGCICPDVLTGRADPSQCPLFGLKCRPGHPVGACMVSREGACYIWHKYSMK